MKACRPDDGSPAFTEALRTTKLYGTDPLDNRLPDLMLTWDRSRPFRGIEIPGIARFVADPQSVRTGDHREGGLAMFAGRPATTRSGRRRSTAPRSPIMFWRCSASRRKHRAGCGVSLVAIDRLARI